MNHFQTMSSSKKYVQVGDSLWNSESAWLEVEWLTNYKLKNGRLNLNKKKFKNLIFITNT